jgi:hypothetical protein
VDITEEEKEWRDHPSRYQQGIDTGPAGNNGNGGPQQKDRGLFGAPITTTSQVVDPDYRHPGVGLGNASNIQSYRSSSAASAIENLPSYERFLDTTRNTVLGEMEDAKAGADRHVQLSSSVGDGMGRLAALRVDVQTIGEGGRVAEQAAIVRDRSAALAAALADLDSAVQAAKAGLRRQQPAQELANSNVLAERPAYDGA